MNAPAKPRLIKNIDELSPEEMAAIYRAADAWKEAHSYNPSLKFSKSSYLEIWGKVRFEAQVDVHKDVIALAIKRLKAREASCSYRERRRQEETQDIHVSQLSFLMYSLDLSHFSNRPSNRYQQSFLLHRVSYKLLQQELKS